MKLKNTLLAAILISSVASLSSSAESVVISAPPVPNGSNASRAPLPMNLPSQYNRSSTSNSWASGAVVVAKHIDGQTQDQFATTSAAKAVAQKAKSESTVRVAVITPAQR